MKKEKKERLICWGLVLLGTLVYLSLIFNWNLWIDEALSLRFTENGYVHMLAVLKKSDMHPPLYYYLLKIWKDIFGSSIPALKIVSILPMTISMILGATVIRKRFGFLTAVLFQVCMFTMPQLLEYGVQLRMYSWAFFAALGSGVFAYELTKEKSLKNYGFFVLCSILGAYSHYYACLSVAFVFLFLLIYDIIKDRAGIRGWLCCFAVMVVLYLPWTIGVLVQHLMEVNGGWWGGWTPEVTFGAVLTYCKFPFVVGNDLLSALLMLGFIGLCGYFLWKSFIRKKWREEEAAGFLGVCILFLVALLAIIVSKIIDHPIIVNRYLFPMLGFIWLFVSILAAHFDKRLYGGILVLFCIMGAVTYQKEWKLEYAEGLGELQAYMEKNLTEEDLIVSSNYEVGTTFSFYYPQVPFYAEEQETMVQSQKNADRLKNVTGNRWYFMTTGDDAHLQEYEDAGYKPEYIGEFGFDVYHFSLYRLDLGE